MAPTLHELKANLRQQVRARLARLAEKERLATSGRARALLKEQAAWTAAQSILFFAPTADELDLWPLLKEALAAGKKCALPRFVRESQDYCACEIRDPDLEVGIGRFGIREPMDRCAQVPLDSMDLILVPGVAFDLKGRRLGRGQGFYDRLLAQVRGTTCGVAFDEQILPEIPIAPHDVHLDCLLTPTRWIER